MANELRTFGGRWAVTRRIGKGGQGVVYEVRDLQGMPSRTDLALMVQAGVREMTAVVNAVDPDIDKFDRFVQAIRAAVAAPNAPRAALKELLPIDEAVNAETAIGRMKSELETLKAVRHPSLIQVLDERLEERWFVTEYFKNGPLSNDLERYKGRVLDAFRAFRSLVDATATLHDAGIVHRDIKPENVFIADDERLVLGDCGLAIKLENQDRITLTYENVGTRDYQPGWSYGMRLEDVRPTFDVYSLGKLLWAMISGKPRFPLWYFNRPQFDLRQVFTDGNIVLVHRLLEKAVVEFEEDCKFVNAAELLEEIDRVIIGLEVGGQVPSRKRPMRCRFCGTGEYEQRQFRNDGFADPQDRLYHYRCNNCGHVEAFFFPQDTLPPGWAD